MNKIIIILMTIIGLVYAGHDTIPQKIQLQETISVHRPITPTVIGAILTSHGGTLFINSLILFGSDSFPNHGLAFACLFASGSEVIIGITLLRFRVVIARARDTGMTKSHLGITFNF